MNSYAEKITEQPKTTADNTARPSFINNRPEAQVMQNLQHSANSSPQVNQLQAYQKMANDSDSVVQRQPKKQSFMNGDLFTVLKSDLNKGTKTSKGTRDYVNNINTNKPTKIKFDYATRSIAANAEYAVTSTNFALSTENPEADYSYRTGKLWDAGHKLGSQNGGLGDDNDWVFPQNPSINQGNSKNSDAIEETFPKWREHENKFHDGVDTDGAGAWWVKLEGSH